MSKVTITLDLNKLKKDRISERTFTNKEGQEVTVREYKIDVVELPQEKRKTITEGDTWYLEKTHFVVDSPTKEEREAKTQTGYVGEGVSFRDKEPVDGVNDGPPL